MTNFRKWCELIPEMIVDYIPAYPLLSLKCVHTNHGIWKVVLPLFLHTEIPGLGLESARTTDLCGTYEHDSLLKYIGEQYVYWSIKVFNDCDDRYN